MPHAVVVGAGLAGLSAAMHLAAAGRQVTVLERSPTVGGLAAPVVATGRGGAAYRLDTGPTVLTMPTLLARPFEALGEDLAAWVTLRRLDPAYRAHFADGSTLDVTADPATMAERIAGFAGASDAAGYLRYVDWVSSLYRVQFPAFVDRDVGSPLRLVRPALARLVALGGFGRWGPRVDRFVADERLRRVLSFQALYAGMSPARALALYAVISYMDLVEGVYYPQGGMAALPVAMAAAAQAHGVQVRTDTPVTGVTWRGGRAVQVRTAERAWACDEVVVTTDGPAAYRLLGRDGRRVERRRPAPSCVVLAAGLTEAWDTAPTVHHSMHFGRAWEQTFADLDAGRLMGDPSWLLSVPSVGDAGLAPRGGHVAYVLFPTPHLQVGPDAAQWQRLRGPYRERILATLAAAGHPGFSGALDAEVLLTPTDWADRGLAAGTPFAAAHTVAQTGPFRTPMRVADNVVLAGASTHPGVGVPTVLVSGRLAARYLVQRRRA